MIDGCARIPVLPAGADPLPGFAAGSRLEHALRQGRFAITAELNPPDSADPFDVYEAACPLSEVADAVNATDASGANCHMSSIGICSLLTRAGYEVVYQISCRDRNRIAIQGDVLSAAAMGVRNVLCLTGDSVGMGDHPEAQPVFDLDSLSLLTAIKKMRDTSAFLSGRKITTPPRLFLGATENPCVPPHDWRPEMLAKKIAAGAQFIQTNYVFDIPPFERFMARARDLGLHERAFILVGVGPLTSARAARWMRSNVPGVHIPDALIERLERSPNPGREGKRICIELIQHVRQTPGVAGIHVMAYRRETLVSEIIIESGLLEHRHAGRRRVKHAGSDRPVSRTRAELLGQTPTRFKGPST